MILTKRDFYRRLRAGEFKVNDNHRWYDLNEWVRDCSHLDRTWGLQSIAKPGSRCDYHVPTAEVCERIIHWPHPGYVISPMLPDAWITVQGEYLDGYLHYSRAPLPMRRALKEHPEHAEGTKTKIILEHLLPPEDVDDMMSLRARYPGHVIEFSSYGVPVGTLSRRTVFWEVRAY